MKTVLVGLILVLLLAACGGRENQEEPTVVDASRVQFWHDDERDVSCWICNRKSGYAGMGGIACIPAHLLEIP